MMENMQLTRLETNILTTIEAHPNKSDYMRRLGLLSNTPRKSVYVALDHLQRLGLLTMVWEDTQVAGRPRRRLYSLTPLGEKVVAGQVDR